MNVIPARLAGVREIVLVTPPKVDGTIGPEALAAARIAGADRIFKIGGAQAVAALAYGTESVPRVDKIVGPGGIFVATAKRKVFGRVAIDMIAGPSEILVIADGQGQPRLGGGGPFVSGGARCVRLRGAGDGQSAAGARRAGGSGDAAGGSCPGRRWRGVCG